jgi:hypothetical protein
VQAGVNAVVGDQGLVCGELDAGEVGLLLGLGGVIVLLRGSEVGVWELVEGG